MNPNNDIAYDIAALMRERYASYPPILSIPMVAKILQEEVPTIRARIRKGTFPVTVRQDAGCQQYVLLVDLLRFVCTGEPQQVVVRPVRLPRNPLGHNGKRQGGRPTKAEQLRKQKQAGANNEHN